MLLYLKAKKLNVFYDKKKISEFFFLRKVNFSSNILKWFNLESICLKNEPIVLKSEINDPFLNLAIEEFIFKKIPLTKNKINNCDRLFFYVNSPSVVIGKNQNPWKELNLNYLNNLSIPVLRRDSGGGAVFHDTGNVNFSYMSSKNGFDRLKFCKLICDTINNSDLSKSRLEFNDKGDIFFQKTTDNDKFKVSGSAYKFSKEKVYHHGTMLLNLNLKILNNALTTTYKQGIVNSSSINSRKSKVSNLNISINNFISLITNSYYSNINNNVSSNTSFSTIKSVTFKNIFIIDESTFLPESIYDSYNKSKDWNWVYGNTQSFTHEIFNSDLNLSLKFFISKGGFIQNYELNFMDSKNVKLNDKIKSSLDPLKKLVNTDRPLYKGNVISKYVSCNSIKSWICESIDGLY